jgi:hypothetical protein
LHPRLISRSDHGSSPHINTSRTHVFIYMLQHAAVLSCHKNNQPRWAKAPGSQGPSPSASLSLSLKERRQRLIVNAGIKISSVDCCREISTAGRAGRLGGRSRVICCNASACVASSSAAHILLRRGVSSHLSLDCMYCAVVLYRHSCLRDGLAQGSRSTPRLSMRAIPPEDSLARQC